MKIGDRVRLTSDTPNHKKGTIGTIVKIDRYFQHCLHVKFPDYKYCYLLPIHGHCASLLVCDSKPFYEVLPSVD